MKDLRIEQNNFESADSIAIEMIDTINKAILSNFTTLPEKECIPVLNKHTISEFLIIFDLYKNKLFLTIAFIIHRTISKP